MMKAELYMNGKLKIMYSLITEFVWQTDNRVVLIHESGHKTRVALAKSDTLIISDEEGS